MKTGDSLSGIAARFGYVTPTQLAKINRLPLFSGGVPPVFPGQKLIIPTASRGVTSVSIHSGVFHGFNPSESRGFLGIPLASARMSSS